MLERTRETTAGSELLELVRRQVTPEDIGSIAAQLGEDRDRTASAVSTSVPSVLAALSDVAKTDRGAAHLKAAIEAKEAPAARIVTPSLLDSGPGGDASLLDDELGPRSWTLSDTVARASGIKRESAHRLMGGVTSVAITTLARAHAPTSPEALRTLLGSRSSTRTAVQSRAEPTLARRSFGGPAIRPLEGPRRGWLFLPAALGLATLIAIPMLRSSVRRRELLPPPPASFPHDTTPVAPTPPAPLASAAAIPSGSAVRDMETFLASDEGGTPRRFTLTPMSFETAATQPSPESLATVDQVAEVLRAHPSSQVLLESYTDSVGTPSSNDTLSQERSETVKAMLVARGVEPSRITTTGLGQEGPIATNDTAEGRARNRRTDIVVTRR